MKQGKPAKHVRTTKCSTSPSVRLPVFPITAAVQQEPRCPAPIRIGAIPTASLCSYGLYVCCSSQRNLQPLAVAMFPSPRCCVARLGWQHSTGGRDWRSGRRAAVFAARSCILQRSGTQKFSMLMCRPRLLEEHHPRVIF